MGERDSHIKWTGLLAGNLKRSPTRTKILFCGPGLKFCSLIRGTNSKTSLVIIVSAQYPFNTLKGIAKASAVDHLRLNILRDMIKATN